MTARYMIGDVRERMAQLPAESFDVIICSPPFLALRSYLPADHPGKAQEIGSEATPAHFLNVLLDLTAEWGRLLAPHGSLAIELGDTYSGSGGSGGDYNEDGWRDGQPSFRAERNRLRDVRPGRPGTATAATPRPEQGGGTGWPLSKSLCGIPTLYAWSLAYGHNLLTGQPSPAGMWRIRNLKPWIRSNPPVGALGDKERPATSYVVVATRARDRYFDLDAVRTPDGRAPSAQAPSPKARALEDSGQHGKGMPAVGTYHANGGAPPRDWWHHVDAILDAELDARAGKRSRWGGADTLTPPRRHAVNNAEDARGSAGAETFGARGVHLRRALERAGILTTHDALDVSPKGYSGAHYAVWPTQLVRLLLAEMCPRRVCTTCGQPSRRITGEATYTDHSGNRIEPNDGWRTGRGGDVYGMSGGKTPGRRTAPTVGWSDCGHDAWRPGRVLDPFVGSGTTLEVATGMGHEAVGIDIDMRNALLALDRVGPLLLHIDWPNPNHTLPTLPPGSPHPADYSPWAHRTANTRLRHIQDTTDEPPAPRSSATPNPDPVTPPRRTGRTPTELAGQTDLFDTEPEQVPA